jgi:hypothetical protein
MAHAYNASYSRGRDQEDRDWKQPGQIVPETLSKKKKITKARGVAQGVGPEFKPQYRKKELSK